MKKLAALLVLAMVCALALSASAASYDRVLTVASPTYARSGPGTNYKIVYELTPGYSYPWSGDSQRDGRGIVWYGIYDGSRLLWLSGLHSVLYNSYSGTMHNNGRNGSNSKNCSVYATRNTYIYAGPGKGYRTIDSFLRGDSADFTGFREKSGGTTWYQISYYGTCGWVPSGDTAIR